MPGEATVPPVKLAALKVTALSSVPLTEIGASVGAVLMNSNAPMLGAAEERVAPR